MLQSFTIVFKQSMLLAISSRLVASQHLQKQSSFVARNECLRRNVPHCREHGNSAVLEFRLTTTLEVLHATVRGKSSRIPKSDWLLNTKLVLKGVESDLCLEMQEFRIDSKTSGWNSFSKPTTGTNIQATNAGCVEN